MSQFDEIYNADVDDIYEADVDDIYEADVEIYKIRKDLPMIHRYDNVNNQAYKRQCYTKLYRAIERKLKGSQDIQTITVTGTPGVGKSMFYQHVFNNLRSSSYFKGFVFVAASFDENSKLYRARVFKPSIDIGQSIDERELNALQDNTDMKAIHLYDGAPRQPPDCRMVTFTSPNATWFAKLRKVNSNTHKFYMETWSQDELYRANRALRLGISKDAIDFRYLTFGGVARMCLSLDSNFITEEQVEQAKAVTDIVDFKEVSDCLANKRLTSAVHHRLFHFVPPANDSSSLPTIKFGSTVIKSLILDHLSDKNVEQRRDMIDALDTNSKSAVFRGWLFESEVHHRLSNGVQGRIRQLIADIGEPVYEDFVLQSHSKEYCRIKKDTLVDRVSADIYLRPVDCNFEALDSAYHDTGLKCLYVFQSTLSTVHHVKANGVLQLLKTLDLVDDYDSGMLTVKFVFVVPEPIAAQYKLQDIAVPMTDLSLTLQDAQIPGIKTGYCIRLNKNGIMLVGHLVDAVRKKEFEKYSFVRQYAESFVEKIGSDEFRERIRKIKDVKQYVLGLPIQDEKLAGIFS